MSLRTLFFVINFTGSIAILMGHILLYKEAFESNRDIGMGIFLGCVTIVHAPLFALGEWCGYMHGNKAWEQILGVTYGVLGVLFTVCLVGLVVEMLTAPADSVPQYFSFWVFFSILLMVPFYLFWCCWYRTLRRVPKVPCPAGPIPVIPSTTEDSSNPIT